MKLGSNLKCSQKANSWNISSSNHANPIQFPNHPHKAFLPYLVVSPIASPSSFSLVYALHSPKPFLQCAQVPGGHYLFKDRYQKQRCIPPILCHHSPLSLSMLVYSTRFLRHQTTAYCYYVYVLLLWITPQRLS